MIIVNNALCVFGYVKKIYFLLYNFMIGTETNKFSKIYVHLATIILFVYSPFHYYNFVINFFEIIEGVITTWRLTRIILIFLMPVIFASGVKVMMLLKW